MKRSECAEFLRGSLRLQEENGQRRAAKPKTEGRGPELEEKRGLVTVIAFLKGRKWLSRPSREQSKPISDMPAHTDPLLDVANRSDDDDRGRSAASWFSSSLLLHGSLPACCFMVLFQPAAQMSCTPPAPRSRPKRYSLQPAYSQLATIPVLPIQPIVLSVSEGICAPPRRFISNSIPTFTPDSQLVHPRRSSAQLRESVGAGTIPKGKASIL